MIWEDHFFNPFLPGNKWFLFTATGFADEVLIYDPGEIHIKMRVLIQQAAYHSIIFLVIDPAGTAAMGPHHRGIWMPVQNISQFMEILVL